MLTCPIWSFGCIIRAQKRSTVHNISGLEIWCCSVITAQFKKVTKKEEEWFHPQDLIMGAFHTHRERIKTWCLEWHFVFLHAMQFVPETWCYVRDAENTAIFYRYFPKIIWQALSEIITVLYCLHEKLICGILLCFYLFFYYVLFIYLFLYA